MFQWLGLSQSVPTVVPTDKIVPLHWFEDGVMWKKVIVYTLFVFDDALSPDKLRDSLERLVNREGYRKLGGRLRRNVRPLCPNTYESLSHSPSRPKVEWNTMCPPSLAHLGLRWPSHIFTTM